MRVPMSWLREYADLPTDLLTEDLADRLTALGLKLEALERPGEDLQGPLVVGRVLSMEPEPQKNGRTINWCAVDVGPDLNRANGTGEPGSGVGIVCGAHNFGVGDLVVCVLPGGVLPGPFEISARKTYGHVSAGMICSAAELGLGQAADGIVVLPADFGEPGDDVIERLGLRDEVIEFEINPDRAYAMSLRGVARESALAYGVAFHDPALRDTPPADPGGWPVEVGDSEGCPVFVTRTVSGFDPTTPTPDWMVHRLALVGQRSISLAVDVTNYVMFELGRPIHGYDADKVQGALRIRRAGEGERLTTLDGQERALSTEDLVVTDDSGIIGLGGVMGGQTTEMSETTTRVLVEAAHWDATAMFRTGRRHRLSSEAGKRNERGVDPTICEAAADRVATLLAELGGGAVEPGVTVVGTAPVPGRITIPIDLPARVSGMNIASETTLRHLRAVGCEVDESADTLTATPPPWRPDLSDPYDLVEEVTRIVGYDEVPSVLPPAPAGRGLTKEQRLRRRIGQVVAGAGCSEVISFPFVGPADFDDLGLPKDDVLRRTVRLANPLSAERPSYTTTLLPGVLRAAARNLSRGAPEVALFETGLVVRAGDRAHDRHAPIYGVDAAPSAAELEALLAAVPAQPLFLAAVIAGERERTGWWGAGRGSSWADAVGLARELGAELGVDVQAVATDRAPWHPGRCAQLCVEGVELGHAGELHPRVCRAFGLTERSAALEIDLDLLMRRAVEPRGPVMSTFPVAKEDVALVVDAGLPAEQLAATLREGAGAVCESVRLFDLYTGPQVGEGRKSLAFALRFRAVDRTLTEQETGAARDDAVALAARRHGAEQRS